MGRQLNLVLYDPQSLASRRASGSLTTTSEKLNYDSIQYPVGRQSLYDTWYVQTRVQALVLRVLWSTVVVWTYRLSSLSYMYHTVAHTVHAYTLTLDDTLYILQYLVLQYKWDYPMRDSYFASSIRKTKRTMFVFVTSVQTSIRASWYGRFYM